MTPTTETTIDLPAAVAFMPRHARLLDRRRLALLLGTASTSACGGPSAFALRFLDAVHDAEPAAPGLLTRLGRFVPDDGVLPVAGGTADEVIRPLDIAPEPGRPARSLFAEQTIEADLRRLASGQQDDGGWRVEFAEFSPAGALEWRGLVTVDALGTLRANGLVRP